MLAQINDGCAICRLVAHCVDPEIALRDLPIAQRNRQIAQIHRLRLTYLLQSVMYIIRLKIIKFKSSLKLPTTIDYVINVIKIN